MLQTPPKTGEFYREVLEVLLASKIPFLLSGTYAVSAYTGIERKTKDLDVFCKMGDQVKILHLFESKGFKTSVPDERWLAKIHRGRNYCDIIFTLASSLTPINDEWFVEKHVTEIFGLKVPIIAPTELIW